MATLTVRGTLANRPSRGEDHLPAGLYGHVSAGISRTALLFTVENPYPFCGF